VIGLVAMILGWSFPDLRDGLPMIGAILAACRIGNLISIAV